MPCAALLTVALVACSDTPTGGPKEPQPSAVVLTQMPEGDRQSGIGGVVLPRHLQVRATRDGVPVAGIAIIWSTGSGSVSPEGSFTSSHGIASTRWTLGDDDGEVKATAAIYDAPDQQVEFLATSWPRVEVQRVSGRTIGEVGLALDPVTQVRVTRHGKPAAGIPVTWDAMVGQANPAQSVTDQDGVAGTTWTLGQTVGTHRLLARVRGHVPGLVTFDALARSGPPASIVAVGTYMPQPANFRHRNTLIRMAVTDRFGNPVDYEWIQWMVLSGPGIIDITAPPSSTIGEATAYLRPTGTPGAVVVRVTAAAGTIVSQDFTFTMGDPVYEVYLAYNYFRSPMNGTQPAVDTIPVGTTLRWQLTPFDYEDHAVEPMGLPAFVGGGPFPYANPSVVTATFTEPGTYHYRDPHGGGSGTVVVQ